MWLGGQVFGNFALNPAAATISDPAERGKVVNAGWARYSGFGYGALGAAAVTHAFARLTELRPGRQSRWERILTTLEDLLHVSAVGLTAATGSQGARLGAKGSDGAVPIASGDEPAPQTPPDARDAQVKVNRLGNITTFVGTSLVAVARHPVTPELLAPAAAPRAAATLALSDPQRRPARSPSPLSPSG